MPNPFISKLLFKVKKAAMQLCSYGEGSYVAIRHTYTRHFHTGYSIGIIEGGVGGNFYRGST
jgi:hypothetical protein